MKGGVVVVCPHGPNVAANSSSSQSSTSSAADLSLSASSQTRLLLLRAVHSLYRRWAFFIVRHSRALILFCTLLSALCTLKVATTPHQNDITGYTPYGARSRQELAIREQFFNAQGLGPPFGVFLLLLPRAPEDNFLSAKMLAEAARIDELVRRNFPLKNRKTNRTEVFADFCGDFCAMNEPLRRFEEGFRHQSERLEAKEPLNPTIQLDYPTSAILGRKFNIQPNFFGIHFAKNGTTSSNGLSNMERVEMLALNYRAERVGDWTDQEVKDWEMAVSRYFDSKFRSSLVRVLTASNTYVELEVVRAGLSMLPFLIVGFSIMFCCTSISVLLSAAYMGQLNVRKFWLALMACVCPFMATGTALGLLFICGVRFSSVLCVTPFLVLAIGVDDAYLMIHAWQRIGKRGARAEGQGEEQETVVAQRLALVLVDTGPAILISALTNICADAVGSLTGSPEITLLCVGNMAAIAVDFLFQCTFYAAVMALVGESELKSEQQRAGKRFRVRIPIGGGLAGAEEENGNSQKEEAAQKSGNLVMVNWMEKQQIPQKAVGREKVDHRRHFGSSFLHAYVRLITRPWAALGICLFWLAFLAFAAIGVSRFEVNLSTKKLFAADSPLLEIDAYREHQIVPFFTMATVFINNPGNLSDPRRLDRINQLVEALEELPESWGPPSTNYFVRELVEFVGDERDGGGDGEAPTPLMDKLHEFLEWPEQRHWRAFIRFKQGQDSGANGTTDNGAEVERFFFTTAYHGPSLTEWPERTRLLKQWRAVVDQFEADLNASVFHEEGIFLDLIDNMPSDAWQSAVATLLCMCLVCAIFMGHDWRTVLVAGTVIGSIILGTLGILAWMGVSMDPIMMAALIISIGFSVDIPAHIAYHFHSAAFEQQHDGQQQRQHSPPIQHRLRVTLASVGAPALQASLSTSLCVLALLFVPLYMAQIFVRIMCTCILLCILHSLLLIPALFALVECAKSLLLLAIGCCCPRPTSNGFGQRMEKNSSNGEEQPNGRTQ